MIYTLAHLSDPHLAPIPRPRFGQLIGKRAAGYFNWGRSRRFIHRPAVLAKIVEDLRAKPDHLVVSGDIVNIALPAEFVRGRDWLGEFGRIDDVTFVPGNHDIYVPAAIALANRYFGGWMRSDSGEPGFPFVRRRGPLALIGLNSGVPTPPWRATGHLGAEQLAKLAAILDAQKDQAFRVIIVHHPPVSEAARKKRLLDADALKQVIAAHGAELLIHGHDHRHMLNWLDGPNGTRVPALGVPSASAVARRRKDGAAYNLYRIDGAPGAWRCEVVTRGIGADGSVVELKRMTL